MSWLRVDDGFSEHEKIENLSDRAFRLHVSALCLCARLLTDGRITDTNLRKLAAAIKTTNVTRYVTELVDARLWSVHPKGGWRIKDFLEYNPSSVQVKEKRTRNAERQREWRHRNGVTNSAPSPTPDIERTKANNGPLDETLVTDVERAKRLSELVSQSFEAVA